MGDERSPNRRQSYTPKRRRGKWGVIEPSLFGDIVKVPSAMLAVEQRRLPGRLSAGSGQPSLL